MKVKLAKSFCQAIILRVSTFFPLICLYHNAVAGNIESGETAYWILFDSKSKDTPVQVSDKSLERREDRSQMKIGCWYDYPVNRDYVRALRQKGARIRHVSRWLNAASVSASPEVLAKITKLPFVKEIKRVSSYSRLREIEISAAHVLTATSVLITGRHTIKSRCWP